jgi:hypothetical protein
MGGRMMGSTANGSWENYHMESEHMCINNLFLNDFIKVFFLDVISGWMRILGTWIVNMWGLTVVGW